jgi:hypothetical protein
MAVVLFGFIYLLAAAVYTVVTLPAGIRARARGFASAMLSPMGTLFALFVVFTAAQVWNDNDRAKEAVDQEASALRATVILIPAFPEDLQRRLQSLIRSHIEDAATKEWPMMARHASTLKAVPRQLAEALQLTLDFKPSSQGQEVAQHEMVAKLESALDARRERILISQLSISGVKWGCLWVELICVLVTIALVHANNRGGAVLAMGLFATGAAVCILLIGVYDRPFDGQFAVRPDPLMQVMPEAPSPASDLNH